MLKDWREETGLPQCMRCADLINQQNIRKQIRKVNSGKDTIFVQCDGYVLIEQI
jgi:hypothetical protein